MFRLQIFDSVVFLLPADDRFEVFVAGHEIAEGRMIDPSVHRFLDGRNDREIHIRDPHRDNVKTFFWCESGEAEFLFGRTVNSDGVMMTAVHDRCEIKLCHFFSPSKNR